MSNSPMLMECPEITCLHGDNPVGQQLCDRCQTPLIYRYLWAVGSSAPTIPEDTWVTDRYRVTAPQIWLDTKPGRSPDTSLDLLPEAALPYLKLLPYRLHLPQLYTLVPIDETNETVWLLDNVPIAPDGTLLASLASAWDAASPSRQVYWLWQLLQLWLPLLRQGVTCSLLMLDNVRVEGWRVRLLELCPDAAQPEPAPTLQALAQVWSPLVAQAKPTVAQPLREILQQMDAIALPFDRALMEPNPTSDQPPVPPELLFPEFQAIAQRLNRLLLEQASQLPLRLSIAGGTSAGPQRVHNEDGCYPDTIEGSEQTQDDLLLMPRFALVCDGIGGHAGGEVASQLAVRSLKLQICAMLTEVAEQAELLSPHVVIEQLEAIVRVVNNIIAAQNDSQGRAARQRMGTTLVMALQLPQQVISPAGANNTHELYLAHVGDSRAYWMTSRYCHPLTLDDDVAAREVRLGRSLPYLAMARPDAGALTQALGTRDGELLRPNVQRFILEEDGLLLLCSDGLSDNHWVERMWEHSSALVLRDKMSLQAAVQAWIDLANQKNGHDNTSVVLMRCQVSPMTPQLMELAPYSDRAQTDEELSASARALLYDEEGGSPAPDPDRPDVLRVPVPRRSPTWVNLALMVLLGFVTGAIVLTLWRQLAPESFQRVLDRLTPTETVPPDSAE